MYIFVCLDSRQLICYSVLYYSIEMYFLKFNFNFILMFFKASVTVIELIPWRNNHYQKLTVARIIMKVPFLLLNHIIHYQS
jgi:hypothetical protein